MIIIQTNLNWIRLKSYYDEQTETMKTLIKIIGVFLLVFSFGFIAWLVGSIYEFFQPRKLGGLYYGLTSCIIWSLLSYALILFIFYKRFFMDSKRNEVEQVTKDGTRIVKNKSGGVKRYAFYSEIKNNFYIGPAEEAPNTILGQDKNNPDYVVAIPEIPNDSNQNDLVISQMGRGKTAAYVINELIGTILRGWSFLCNDPKAELVGILLNFLTNRKVNVGIFNLANLDRSEYWNCIQETVDPKTQRIDPTRLNIFADTFMMNSGNGENDFWNDSARNLLRAIIGYTSWEHEQIITENYKELYKQITGVSENDPIVDKMSNTLCSYTYMQEKIIDAAKKNGYNIKEVQELIDNIQKEYQKYTFNEVYNNVMNFATIDAELFINIPEWHPAHTSFVIFMSNGTPQVRDGAIQGTMMRFQLFSDYRLREILSHDGIILKDINKKQSAYFVITNDKSKTYRCFASLFFSFFYQDAMETFDEADQLSKDNGTPNPTIPVTCMLEEAFTLGIVTGDRELYATYMSTSRSRMIHSKFIIQFYSQLIELYGENLKDGIESACNNLIFLGCRDYTTAQWVSKFIGNTTAMTESHGEGTTVFNNHPEDTSSIGAAERPLIYPEELLSYPQYHALIQCGTNYPFDLKTFYYKNHPVFKNGELEYTSVYKYVESLDTRIERRIAEKEIDIKRKIHSLKQNIDEETGEIIIYKEPVKEVIKEESSSVFKNFKFVEVEDELENTEEIPLEELQNMMNSQGENDLVIENQVPTLFDETEDTIKEVVEEKVEEKVENPPETKVETIKEVSNEVETSETKPKGRKTMSRKKKTTKSILDD